MKNKNKKMSMAHYMVYMSAVILMVCGLTFLLSSCTEEIIDGNPNPASGPLVAVNFKFAGVNKKGSEVLTRNGTASPELIGVGVLASPFVREGRTEAPFVAHVVDDIYMYANLEENREIMLRADTVNLSTGTKLRIVAYEGGTTWRASEDYTIDGNYELAGNVLRVNPGLYTFVAYSYNSTTELPAHSEIISNIDPATDLLWGIYPSDNSLFTVSASSYKEVPVTMSHAFSQVQLKVTAEEIPGSPNIKRLDDVKILPDFSVDLVVKTGALMPGGATLQSFSTWQDMGTSSTVTSELRQVYTHDILDNTLVSFGRIEIDGYPLIKETQVAQFDKKLQPGVSYTLKVKFQKGLQELIVIPNKVSLSPQAHNPAATKLAVEPLKDGQLDPTMTWTLTSAASWLKLSLDPNGSDASKSVTGTGSKYVYLVLEENPSSPRLTVINHNGLNKVEVYQAASTVPIITVTPAVINLSYLAQSPAFEAITVTPSTGGVITQASWTLRTSKDWLWLTPNADGKTGLVNTFTTALNGAGKQTIYLVAGKNSTSAPRIANITLNGTTDVRTEVIQGFFNAIGQTGTGIERIYIEDNNYNPKLMLTKNNDNPGAFFQFGGIKGWKQPTGTTNGVSATYNPSHTSSVYNSAWIPSGYKNGYVVEHSVASLRAGTGDPCRLVGFTQKEIADAIDPDNPKAFAPDNQAWRLPDKGQLEGYTGVSTTFPRFGYVNSDNGLYLDKDVYGYYWGSWQSAGNATYTNAGLFRWGSNTSKVMWSFPPANLTNIRCVTQ